MPMPGKQARRLSRRDYLLDEIGHALKTIFGRPLPARSSPSKSLLEGELSPSEQEHAARLMRVNHSGEVCAQALYRGQALCARNAQTRDFLLRAAAEEEDHLAWCEERIHELGYRPSFSNLFWYVLSWQLGFIFSRLGDDWNLGFVEETEDQVVAHLATHLGSLSAMDYRTRAILEQMKIDEGQHGNLAARYGARVLPGFVKKAMRLKSKVMTTFVYANID